MNDEEKNSYIGPLIRQVSRHTLNGYNELRLNEKLCDASLILDNGEIYPIHRSLLSGSSDYFRILFNTLHEKQCEKIHLRSIESSTIEQILQYIYVSQVDICYDNVLDIMQTADYLRIDGLVQLCYELLTADYMGPDNCVTLLQFADDYFFSQLVKATYKYIIKEFINIVNQDNDLMKLKKEEFIRIIQDNQLNVKREECVWEILIKWIDVDPDNRTNDLAFLLPGIRFGLMNIKYFVDNVQTHHYIKNRADCAPYITEAYTFLCNPASFATNFLAPTFARPRYPFEVLFAIGGWSGGSPTGIIETYDIKSNRWTQIYSEDPLGPRSYHGTLVMNHDIYVIGGFDGLEYFSSCRKFNTITKTWSQIAPMNSKRCYVSVVMLNNIIYAMGGYNSQYRLNSVEKYDFKRNQWTMVAPMIFQRSDACATVLNNRIYVTGGFDGQTCMNTAEVYNVETNEWTLLPQMSTRRSGVCCVAYHGLLYVLGGFDGSSRMNSCEKYDPATCRWSTVADMRNPRSNFGVEVLDDTIFAAGGFNGVATIALVERYDDRTDRWSNVKSMRVYRSALSACVLKDLPNVEHYVHPYKDKFIRKDGKTIERNSQPGDYNNAAIDENHSPALNADRSSRHRLHIIHEDNEVPANRHPGE